MSESERRAPGTDAVSDAPTLDIAALRLTLSRIGVERTRRILDLFATESAAYLREIEAALADNRRADVETSAHRLKSAAGSLHLHFIATLLLLLGTSLAATTIATNDLRVYRVPVLVALTCSVLGGAVEILAFKRSRMVGRITSVLVSLAFILVIADCVRRLPAILTAAPMRDTAFDRFDAEP